LGSFSPIVAAAAERTARAPDADGWREVTVPIASIDDAAHQMLQLGGEAEVLEPRALREALHATAASMAALNAGASRTKRSPAPRCRGRCHAEWERPRVYPRPGYIT